MSFGHRSDRCLPDAPPRARGRHANRGPRAICSDLEERPDGLLSGVSVEIPIRCIEQYTSQGWDRAGITDLPKNLNRVFRTQAFISRLDNVAEDRNQFDVFLVE